MTHKYSLNCIDQDEYKIRGRGPTSEDNLHSIYYTYIYRHYAEIEHLSEYIGNLYIILCINVKKCIRSSFFAGHCPVGEENGGEGGNIIMHV